MAVETSDRPVLTRTQFFIALAFAAAVGAAIAIGGLLLKDILTGDEPPIRVRGGSLDADILSADAAEWQQGNQNEADRKNWYLYSDGSNSNEEYFVKAKLSGVSECGSPPISAKRVEVHFPAQHFDIQHAGHKTMIKTSGGILRPLKKLITFPGSPSHFVEKLTVHGTGTGSPWTCTFTDRTQFVGLCLCANASQCTNLCK